MGSQKESNNPILFSFFLPLILAAIASSGEVEVILAKAQATAKRNEMNGYYVRVY